MDILSALATFDPIDDLHWTTDGAPRLDVLAMRLGVSSVTRQQVRAVAPEFHRDNLKLTIDPPAPAPAETEKGAEPTEPTEKTNEVPAERPEVVRLREVDAEILALQQKRGEIDTQLAKLSREQEALQRFSPTRGYDHKADQEARMEFIRAEQRRQLERVERANKIAAAAGVVAAAPIDRAMARKTARGGMRPAFPVRVQQMQEG